MIQVIIKETPNRTDFYPFSLMHSVAEVRYGALRLIDKIKLLLFKSNIAFVGNDKIIASLLKRENLTNNIIYNVPTLVLYSNSCIDILSINEMMEYINSNDSNIIFHKQCNNGEFAAYYKALTPNDIQYPNLYTDNDNTVSIEIQNGFLLHNLSDVVYCQSQQIALDSKNYALAWYNFIPSYYPNVITVGTNIKIGKGVHIEPNVVLNANKGSIILDDNVTIMSGSVIIGPCYIGKKTIINSMSYIHPGCSFGPSCKIGGEVECSVFHGFSNKQHHGFIGHSYISEWVNIGAGTSNSDLKNNYSHINVQLPHKTINTNKQFLGCLIGDHTKISINCAINTGTIIGCCVNLASTNLTPKLIPSFQWVVNEKTDNYDKTKAFNTIKIAMQRRNKNITQEEEDILLEIKEL